MAVDPLVDLWRDALDAYEQRAGIKLSSPAITPFESSDDVFEFIDRRKTEFSDFREDGKQLRSTLEPIAWTVQTLCSTFGEALALPLSPGKAIFTAIGVALTAAMKVQKDFDAIEDAFETMEMHLRIIKSNASTAMSAVLREASMKVLVQILDVLGVITEMQKSGRLRAWLRNIRHSDVLTKALDELRRLATNQHQTISAVTLLVSQRTLAMFTDSAAWDDTDNILRTFLERVLETSQEAYDLLRKSATATQRQNAMNRRVLEEIQDKLLRLNEDILEERKSDDEGKIFQWLQYPDCSAKINSLLYDRAKGTGSWFFDSNEFSALKTGKKRVLWLEGSAGCGKSTIMAGAIRELRAHCAVAAPQSLILTHFFDTTNSPRHRNLEGLTSSLLCQLSHRRSEVLVALRALHDESMAGHSELSLEKTQHELKAALQSLGARVFVVLDALDEAVDERNISYLEELIEHANVSLLLSSRTEVPYRRDLERLSDARLLVKKSLVARDISAHLDDVLATRGALAKVKGKNIGLVRKALTSRAGGNFRWTVLQIRELSGVAGIPTQLRRMLHDMPKTLTDTYDLAIRMTPERQRDDLYRMLEWLIFSRGLLDKLEYSELLAFEWCPFSGLPKFDVELRPSSPDEVFTIVNSTFISYYGGYIRLAHASVRDYLLDPRSSFGVCGRVAYFHMTRMCIAYLRAVGTRDTPKTRLLGKYHLHYHTRKFWSFYAHRALEENSTDTDFKREVVDFVCVLPEDDTSILALAVKERHWKVLAIVKTVRPLLLDTYPNLPFKFNGA
ncbi:hypothetical protein EV714DRAFT_271481 [Schizophyllum commune]